MFIESLIVYLFLTVTIQLYMGSGRDTDRQMERQTDRYTGLDRQI